MNGAGVDSDQRLAANFRLLAQSASSIAERTDLLFTAMLVVCSLAAIGVCATMVFFCFRYRRGSRASRAGQQHRSLGIELAWTGIPLLLFVALFAWAAYDYVGLVRAPADAMPVYVVAKQWMWKLQHGNGRREINELHVPLGVPVRLVMTSQDAIHSFFVPAFRLKQDVLPGRYTALSFTATQLGELRLFCAEYCGSEHAQMIGRVVVQSQADHARWLQSGPAEPSLAQYGFALYRRFGCGGCHDPGPAGSTVRAPALDGIYGRARHLQSGDTVLADDAYLRDAILLPARQLVAGYADTMPSYAGEIGEEELLALLAYLRSKGTP